MSDTKTPLWKQLLGALAGAAVAFVLYRGFTFISGSFEALVALPTAPGVEQDTIRSASKDRFPRLGRIERRTAEAAKRFGKERPPAENVPSRASPAFRWNSLSDNRLERVSQGPQPLRPTGTLTSPSDEVLATIAAAASSSVSTAASVSSVSISSASSAPEASANSSSESSASSSSALTQSASSLGEGPHPVWPKATLSFPNETIEPHYAASAPLRSGVLPQSGFALGELIVATLGAMVGKKFMRRRGK